MKVKRNFTSGVLLIIATSIMITTDCVNKRGGGPSRSRRAKNSIVSVLTMSPKTFLNWRISNLGSKNY
ncbi:unnamed protein product [Macrosiphum euphorbiae]|uniref:Uncharacterized protein n=1 Tax=Macrosiphum euphorbiae TaxID=13131 RepID=A0AAV0VXX5_9HEMI|nr:unnamed protein product [Macrosiphum euphorbiae]